MPVPDRCGLADLAGCLDPSFRSPAGLGSYCSGQPRPNRIVKAAMDPGQALPSRATRRTMVLVAALTAAATASCAVKGDTRSKSDTTAQDIHRIQHVVVIMQENRSFDTYFGLYPGADGIPRGRNGQFTRCVPDPANATCVFPFHDALDVNGDGPHSALAAIADINGGPMDGF